MSEEELKLLENFKEQICRKNCEKNGMCNDCYIEFEQVQAVEHLLNNYINLIKYLENKIKISSIDDTYINGMHFISQNHAIYQDILERVKSAKYE